MRAAVIQLCSTADVTKNLANCSQLITEAVLQQADLIALPENFAFIAEHEEDKLNHQEPENNGPLQTFLGQQAKNHGVWIIGGTLPIASEDPNKVKARCYVFNPQGEVACYYDKIHLFDVESSDLNDGYIESKVITAGSSVKVATTAFGHLGLSVCYDLRFPELFREHLTQGATLFSVPSAFTYKTGKAHWEILLKARAIENLGFVIAPNQCGQHSAHRHSYGHSMIVDPWGRVLAELQEQPGVAVAELDFELLQRLRKQFPATEHRIL